MVLLHLILNEMSYKCLPLFSAVQEQEITDNEMPIAHRLIVRDCEVVI